MTSETNTEPKNGQSGVDFPKLARLELMLEYLLEETRQVSLDEHGRQRLRDVADQALIEVGDAVSQDLRDELARLAAPLDGQSMPSKDELRVIQAQLKGWSLGQIMAMRALRAPNERPMRSDGGSRATDHSKRR